MAVQRGGLQSLLLPHFWKGKGSREQAIVSVEYQATWIPPQTHLTTGRKHKHAVPNWTIRENVTAKRQVMHCQMHTCCHPGEPDIPCHQRGLGAPLPTRALFQRPVSVGLVTASVKKTFRLYVWLQYRELFPYESWFVCVYNVSGNPQRKVVRSNAS